MYFICQSNGYKGPDTCAKERDELEAYLHPELNAAVYILLALLPWTNLLFAVHIRDVKRAIHRLLDGCHNSNEKSNLTVTDTIH